MLTLCIFSLLSTSDFFQSKDIRIYFIFLPFTISFNMRKGTIYIGSGYQLPCWNLRRLKHHNISDFPHCITSIICFSPEAVDTISACCSIPTGSAEALIDVSFTQDTSETWEALAGETTNSIFTNSPIKTRVWKAFIDLHFTVSTWEEKKRVTAPLWINQWRLPTNFCFSRTVAHLLGNSKHQGIYTDFGFTPLTEVKWSRKNNRNYLCSCRN